MLKLKILCVQKFLNFSLRKKNKKQSRFALKSYNKRNTNKGEEYDSFVKIINELGEKLGDKSVGNQIIEITKDKKDLQYVKEFLKNLNKELGELSSSVDRGALDKNTVLNNLKGALKLAAENLQIKDYLNPLYEAVIEEVLTRQNINQPHQIGQQRPKFQNSEKLKMGFEVEFPFLRVNVKKDIPDSKLGYAYKENLWKFTKDTPVNLNSDECNLEFSTIGGLDKAEITESLKDLQELIASFLGNKNHPKIIYKDITIIQPKKEKKFVTRPQITYTIPLSWIDSLFNRIYELTKREDIKTIIDDYNCNGNELISVLAKTSDKAIKQHLELRRKLFHQEELCSYLKNISPTSKGFYSLLLPYIQKFFTEDNKETIQAKEGVKAKLTLMSRSPFSQMYQILDVNFKAEVDNIFKKLCLNSICTKISSKKGVGAETFKLSEFFESIQDPISFENNDKYKKFYKQYKNKNRDLLSPPIGFADYYSMGEYAIDKDAKNMAIVEVRSFAYHVESILESIIVHNTLFDNAVNLMNKINQNKKLEIREKNLIKELTNAKDDELTDNTKIKSLLDKIKKKENPSISMTIEFIEEEAKWFFQ